MTDSNDDMISDICSDCSDISDLSDIDIISSVNFDLSNGSPINIDDFSILHFNINSITAEGRIEQLHFICQTLNIDVLVLTESKLDETIPSNLIFINGYHEPLRRDRVINGRYGGGVLIYVANHLVFQQKEALQSPNFEHMWVDVKIKKQSVYN